MSKPNSKPNGRFNPDVPVVPLEQIVPLVGGAYESVEYYCRTLKLEVVEDWRGQRALSLADARKLLETRNVAVAEHDDQWQHYMRFVRELKESQVRKRQEDLAARRREVEQANNERKRRFAEWALKEKERELELAASKETRVPSFEDWRRNRS